LAFVSALSCQSDNGKPVDWWLIIKYPVNTGDGSGFQYSYADAKSPSLKGPSRNLVTDSNGALFDTFSQIYNNSGSSDVAYILYNDEFPIHKSHETFAHMKGAIATDSKAGFWVTHSVPNWPPVSSDNYDYPSGQAVYSQSFLCLSLDIGQIEDIGAQLLLDKPFLTDSNMPNSFNMPNLQSVINAQWNTDSTPLTIQVSTRGGVSFDVFAKSREADVELWDDVVEPYYKSGMYVESWMNGADSNKMPSVCNGKYHTLNVRQVTATSDISWTETKDHSKWAITTDNDTNVFCIGDINRQFSQAKRGGGAVCSGIVTIWKSFSSMITKADSC